MDMFVVEGGHPLRGRLRVSGSKNACLPLMAAALLADSPTTIDDVPNLRDIQWMKYLLEHLNARVTFRDGRMTIDPTRFDTDFVPYEIMRRMRASFYALGPMTARMRKARVSLPGGCAIGERPVDLHLRGLHALGAEMSMRQGYVFIKHAGLKGADMSLLGPHGSSVGATINTMMAAALAEGETIIRDAAREPDVVEVGEFLGAMGAEIHGLGTDTITIHGVDRLHGVQWRVMPDRIVAATYACAPLLAGGELTLDNIEPAHMGSTLEALRQWGAQITEESPTSLRFERGEDFGRPVYLATGTYPGLPTDVQPQLMVLAAVARGQSTIRETIYHDRFMHVPELNRLGARIRMERNTAVIDGVSRLDGAPVMASDLRAGAALVLAALAAEGTTHIRRVYHIERGYEDMEAALSSVGACMARTPEVQDAGPADWADMPPADELFVERYIPA